MELRSGAARDKTVLIVRDLQNGSTKDEYRWVMQATGRLDVVQKAIPAFITQLDGYTILIRYSASFTPLLDYSASYRASILEKVPASIRNQSLTDQPKDPFGAWEVQYEVGKQPSYNMVLHDPASIR
ncbi:hypothetical protein [Spirosoma sp.]|uniref:hypothetical protein n=1 Tax=Spirosoma sp. TaxID=1899569 RepID=UPI00262A93DF|nr:hypothetical protein [Spirosoma sp.]MCX6213302.1 hypothetical protein [Spirosoma sp.]